MGFRTYSLVLYSMPYSNCRHRMSYIPWCIAPLMSLSVKFGWVYFVWMLQICINCITFRFYKHFCPPQVDTHLSQWSVDFLVTIIQGGPLQAVFLFLAYFISFTSFEQQGTPLPPIDESTEAFRQITACSFFIQGIAYD